MTDYVATVKGSIVAPGDYVTDFRGEEWQFVRVSRGPEHNGTAKIIVADLENFASREFYDRVFGVEVRTDEEEFNYLEALLRAPQHHDGR